MSALRNHLIKHDKQTRITILLDIQRWLSNHMNEPSAAGLDMMITRLIDVNNRVASKDFANDRIWNELRMYESTPTYQLLVQAKLG